MSANKGGVFTRRVIWALTGLTAVFVTALALLSYVAFDQMEDELIDQILSAQAQELVQRLQNGEDVLNGLGAHELTNHISLWLSQDGAPAGLPVQLRGLNPGLHEIHQLQELDGTWHIVVADIARGRLYVLYDATEHEARVDEFGVLVLGMGLLCIAAAYVLARRLARIAVAPLLDLTQRLADWAPGAPDIAITRDDEAGRLFEAFNRMQNQVDRSIAREREFAANLSHEARTPLAAIRTDAELMLLDDDWPVDARQRLTRIVANVDNIAVALESARSVARDQPRPAERVDLAACVDEAWRDLEPLARAAGLSLRNEVPASQARTLDKYALLTVLRNLVRNAIEHAAPAGLTVTLTAAGALELRDTGKGIAEEELPFVFTRYYAGRLRDAPAAPGANATAARRGLGLAIAKQVCDMQGWRLEVSSRREPPAQGTCFTLHLP